MLARPELRNAFNMLLIGLAFFDTCYIITSLCESVRKAFKAATVLHLLLFPHLLFPGQVIAMTGSVFTIVAIAFERSVEEKEHIILVVPRVEWVIRRYI